MPTKKVLTPAEKKKKLARDRKLVSIKERYEIDFISTYYVVPRDSVVEAVKAVGHSRKKVMKALNLPHPKS
jgi:hypothetical protein